MPKLEEFLNPIPVEISNDLTKEFMISKIDLDYAYGRTRLSEKTSKKAICHNRRKFLRILPIQKR